MRICKEGWPYIVGSFIVGSFVVEIGHIVHSDTVGSIAGVVFLFTAFCLYFFRDPKRMVPTDNRLILAPADGKILEVADAVEEGVPVQVIRIFLSVFDPHLQRAPMASTVRALAYKKGRFLDARDPKAPFENEQNRIELIPASNSFKGPVVVTQIAGLIARRIRCYVKETQTVQAGERIGIIQFGSQVDVTLPKSVRLRVKPGERVKAGESILAEIG